MSYFLILLVFGSLGELVLGLTSITATGGGIVEEGKDMVLKYDVGKEWEYCYWYRYETKEETEYCKFKSQKETATAKKLRCNPETATKSMIYTGKSKTECTITVPKVSPADNKTWAVRVDDQMSPTTTDVVVAKQIENIELQVPLIKAGTSGTVRCKVTGGRPAPKVSYDFEPPREGLGTSSKLNQVPDDDGVFTTEMEIVVKPEISDDGRNVSCKAVLYDGEEKPLFRQLSPATAPLNVVYPPQEAENQTLQGKMGDNLTVSFEILANPGPSDVTWTVLVAKKVSVGVEGNETKYETRYDPLEVTPGQNDDKYAAAELAQEDNNKYKATLVIKNVNEADHNNQYKLVVGSSAGQQTYFFRVSVDGVDGGSAGKDTTNSGLGIGLGVAAVIVVLGVLVGLVVLRKSNKNRGETAPLAG